MKITSCLASKYKDGQHYCPAHSDNEKSIAPASDIFTLSIGVDRDIIYTHIKNGVKKTQKLSDNTLLVFSRASQEYWKHEIPKDDEVTGVRYSLTFRYNTPYEINSTLIIGDSNTRHINFGDGPNTLGKWVPGSRIKASRVKDIPSATDILPYRNVIIHTGVNDINVFNPVRADVLARELERKCSDIHKRYPTTKIFLSPALPTKDYNLNMRISDFNEHVVSLSKKHHNLILIDNSIFLDSHTALLKDDYHSMRHGDLLHLGKHGLRRFAVSLKSYVLGKSLNIHRSLNYRQAFVDS